MSDRVSSAPLRFGADVEFAGWQLRGQVAQRLRQEVIQRKRPAQPPPNKRPGRQLGIVYIYRDFSTYIVCF